MVGVGRDLCGSPSPTPCQSRVTQSRLHRTASRRGWNISREGDSTVPLGSLFQCSVTLRGKKFFLMFSWNFPGFDLCPLPLVLSLGATGKCLENSLSSVPLHARPFLTCFGGPCFNPHVLGVNRPGPLRGPTSMPEEKNLRQADEVAPSSGAGICLGLSCTPGQGFHPRSPLGNPNPVFSPASPSTHSFIASIFSALACAVLCRLQSPLFNVFFFFSPFYNRAPSRCSFSSSLTLPWALPSSLFSGSWNSALSLFFFPFCFFKIEV